MTKVDADIDSARLRAEQKLGKRPDPTTSALGESALARRAEVAKMARLRELRLAKEAAERLAQKPTPKRQARTKNKPG